MLFPFVVTVLEWFLNIGTIIVGFMLLVGGVYFIACIIDKIIEEVQ